MERLARIIRLLAAPIAWLLAYYLLHILVWGS